MRWHHGRWVLLFVLFGTTPSGPFCIREDEVLCEEASSHLAQCCGHTPQMHCIEDQACGTATYPDLAPITARCLMERSCDELRRSGACQLTAWSDKVSCRIESGNCPPTTACDTYRPADACAVLEVLSCH
jgi:hypothetical protein